MNRTEALEKLGLEDGATPEEIKKEYWVLARRYHPDTNPGDSEAEEKFKDVAVAYETLTDSKNSGEKVVPKKAGPSLKDLLKNQRARVDERRKDNIRKPWTRPVSKVPIVEDSPEVPIVEDIPKVPLTIEDFIRDDFDRLNKSFVDGKVVLTSNDLRYLSERIGRMGKLPEDISSPVMIYLDKEVFQQKYRSMSDMVISTGKVVHQADSVEKMLLGMVTTSHLFRELRYRPLTTSRNELGKTKDMFEQVYSTIWPFSEEKNIGDLVDLLKNVKQYTQHLDETRLGEGSNLLVAVLSDSEVNTLEQANNKLSRVYRTLNPTNMHSPLGTTMVAKHYQAFINQEQALFELGYSEFEVGLVLQTVHNIQNYADSPGITLSLPQLSVFMKRISDNFSLGELEVVERMVEPLAIGASCYVNKQTHRAQFEWIDSMKALLPFYSSLDDQDKSLFNKVMGELDRTEGAIRTDVGKKEELLSHEGSQGRYRIATTVEAAAYAGQRLVEEAKLSPDPEKFISEFGNMLRNYRFSGYFPMKLKSKSFRLNKLSGRQKEAYSLMRKEQIVMPGPLEIKKNLIGKLIDIYV